MNKIKYLSIVVGMLCAASAAAQQCPVTPLRIVVDGGAPGAVRTPQLLAAIDRGLPFVVNVLGESQRGLLSRFGKPSNPGEDPFTGLDTLRTPGGIAALAAASGWIECRATTRAAAGDHVVVVAEVVGGDSGSAGAPLVHVRKNGLRY